MRAHPYLKMTTVPFLVSLALTGCNDSGSSSSDPVEGSNLSGKVADGYLVNAEVCLDVDGSGTCDEGEPSTTSGSDGSYELDTELNDAELEDADILVEAVAGQTTDTGAGDGGAAVSDDYSLASPASSDNFVSPVTTLVQAVLRENPQMDRQTAQDYVAGIVETDGDGVLENYLENGNDELHKVAQGIRKAFQTVRGQIETKWSDKSYETGTLRYATRQIVQGRADGIPDELRKGTTIEDLNVEVNESDIGNPEKYAAEIEVRDEAEVVTAANYLTENPRFAGIDLACGDHCAMSSPLKINLNYINAETAGYASLKEDSVNLGGKPADSDFPSSDGKEVTQEGDNLVFPGDMGGDIVISDLSVWDLEGETLRIDSPKLDLDSDLTGVFGDVEVNFTDSSDQALVITRIQRPGEPAQAVWDGCETSCAADASPGVNDLDGLLNTANSSDAAVAFVSSDSNVYFDTDTQTVHEASNGEPEIGAYEVQEDGGEQFMVVTLYDPVHATGVLLKVDEDSGEVWSQDYPVRTKVYLDRMLSASATRKVVSAVLDARTD